MEPLMPHPCDLLIGATSLPCVRLQANIGSIWGQRAFLRSVLKTGRFESVTGQTGRLDSPPVETGQATRLPRAFRPFFRKAGPNRPVPFLTGRLGATSSTDPHFRRQLSFRADLFIRGGSFSYSFPMRTHARPEMGFRADVEVREALTFHGNV